MPEKMRAVRAWGPGNFRLEEVDIPELQEGDILIRMKACSICAGDLKSYHGGLRFWGDDVTPAYVEPGSTPGHEFFGEVVRTCGETEYEVGDWICAEQILPCGECAFCRTGKFWMCTRSAVFGFKNYANGGFADYVRVPKLALKHRVPKDFTLEQGALIEPIACGMHALEKAKITHEDVVVISGLGAIGLSMCNIASQALPKMVIGLEVRDDRTEKALSFGADVVLNPLKCNVAEEIAKLTDGLGCDVYVEASGSPASATQGIAVLKNMGRYVQMGVLSDYVTADWNLIGDGKELSIIGSHLSGRVYDAVIRGIRRGQIRTDGLITHTFPLEQWEQAMETPESDPSAVKVMLVP